MSDEDDWKLSSQDVLEYKKHLQSQVNQDLKDSYLHLETHQEKLQGLVHKLEAAKNQVAGSINETEHRIDESFATLLELFNNALQTRKKELMTRLQQITQNSLLPLLECEKVLKNSLSQTQELLDYGKTLSSESDNFTITKDKVTKFRKQAAANNCLPSVPDLHTVASVSVRIPTTAPSVLTEVIESYGAISKFGPVQITDVSEQPGALLVFWDELSDDEEDEEDTCVEKEYILQYCRANDGDPKKAEYITAYKGPEMKFLLQKLSIDVVYWLRVSISTKEEMLPWSVVRECSTAQLHYHWGEGDDHWRVADSGRLVNKLSDASSVLCFETPQLLPDCTVTVEVVDGTDNSLSDEGLAVSFDKITSPMQMTTAGSLFLCTNGSVLLDGNQKLMKLPVIKKGSIVSFSLEGVNTEKIRVCIDTADKQVTYEWPIPKHLSPGPRLYFSACFTQSCWALKVS